MSENKHIIPYSASDIEKYRKGELSAREMHDLEQAALDDPFLADAIEGMIAQPVTAGDLTDLHERLNRKVAQQSRRRNVLFIRRRIAVAAAVALLLGIGYTFLHQSDRPLHALVSAPVSAAPAAKPAPGAPSPANTQKVASDSIQYTFAQTQVDKKRSAPVLYTRPTSVASEKAKAAQLAKPVADDIARLSSREEDSAPSPAVTTTKNDTTELKAAGSANYFATPAIASSGLNPFVLNGKVLDLQNRPLAGAFLALNGNNSYGITTDEHGQFTLSLHPRDFTRQLIVSMIGYDHASLAVNALSTYDQRDNIIHLRPSSASLDEVVVVGYGLHRNATELGAPAESDEKLDTLWKSAAPVIGRQAYIQYLNIAKKKLGLDSTIAGPETLSFTVSRDGSLSAFKIEQSLSPAHDAGIFRLVTDGPGWHLFRGKKIRASVTVNFP